MAADQAAKGTCAQSRLEGGFALISMARIQHLVVAVNPCLYLFALNQLSQLLLQPTATAQVNG